jgi:hypothetical protein
MQLRQGLLVGLLLGGQQPTASTAQDVSFDADIVAKFLEYTETPVKSVKQVGDQKQPKHPVRSIRQTKKGAPKDKPFMFIITAPGCGACNRLKATTNRGSAVRGLLDDFYTVYLNGPGGMPWTDKWNELGHEGYIPQVYFYDRKGRHINVVNPDKQEWNWHSFTSEDALVGAMREAKARDGRLAAGEDFDKVLGIKKKAPPPPPPPPPGMNEYGCMEGWAGADCDECAPGWGGEDCDVPPGSKKAAAAACTVPKECTSCEACTAAGFGWSIKKGKCGAGFANKRCPEL